MLFREGAEDTHPRDPGSFGRCVALLEQMPEWRLRMKEMGAYGEEWARLVEHWSELAELYQSGSSMLLSLKKCWRAARPTPASCSTVADASCAERSH